MSTPTRQQIADALTSSTVVTGTQFRPIPTGAGAAWPQVAAWDGTDLPPGLFAVTWSIYLVPPQDEVSASLWFDTNMPAVIGALIPLVAVQRVEPISLVAENGQMFAILITAGSE